MKLRTLRGALVTLALIPGAFLAIAQSAAPTPAPNRAGVATPNRTAPSADLSIAARAARGEAKVVHLAVRTDGHDGLGTVEDPRDASSAAKLDALWSALPSGAQVVFGEGVFTTSTGLALADGQRVRGLGADKTTLKLADGTLATDRAARVILASMVDGTGNHVSDLTVHGNRDGQPAFANSLVDCYLIAIALKGLECSIKNVAVRGIFSNAPGELFPIIIESSRGTSLSPAIGNIDGVTIDDVTAYSTAINLLAQSREGRPATAATGVFNSVAHGFVEGDSIYFSSLAGGAGEISTKTRYFVINATPDTFKISTAPSGPALDVRTDITEATAVKQPWITGAIRNCIVTGKSSGGYSRMQAFGCGGWQGVVIEGNTLLDVWSGVFTDTHYYQDVLVQNNFVQIRADPKGMAGFGLFVGGGYSWKNWTIRNNKFVLSSNAYGIALRGNADGFVVEGNEFRRSVATGQAIMFEASTPGNANLKLVNNQADPTLFYLGPPSLDSVLVWSAGNRTLAGEAIAGLPESLGIVGHPFTTTQLAVNSGETVPQVVGSTLYADQESVYLNTGLGDTFLSTGERFLDFDPGNAGRPFTFRLGGRRLANQFFVTDAKGSLAAVPLAARQSVRRNAANSGWEAFTPGVAPLVSSGEGGGGVAVKHVRSTAAALDFGPTPAQSSADLTIRLAGANRGDTVALGVPNGSVVPNSSFSAWVSAKDTVTVRFNNYSTRVADPARGLFRVTILQF